MKKKCRRNLREEWELYVATIKLTRDSALWVLEDFWQRTAITQNDGKQKKNKNPEMHWKDAGYWSGYIKIQNVLAPALD